MNIKQLREKRLSLIHQQKDLYARAEKEDRTLSNDELGQFDKIETDLAEIRNNISAAERLKKNMESLEQRQGEKPAQTEGDRKKAYQKAFLRYASRGFGALNQDERALAREFLKENGTASRGFLGQNTGAKKIRQHEERLHEVRKRSAAKRHSNNTIRLPFRKFSLGVK